MATMEHEQVKYLTRKGRATHDRVVATAAQLMFDHGVAATSLKEVQRASGIGASQISHYFGDKPALVRAVIEHQTRTILDVHSARLASIDSFEGLQGWRDFVVAFQHEHACRGGCPLVGLVSELGEVDDRARQMVATGYALWERAIADGLRRMHERGELRAEADPDALALALLTAYQGGLVLTQARRDTVALEAVLDLALSGIRAACTSP